MEKAKILIIDDQKEVLEELAELLEEEGYDVEVAYDGLEAWEKFQKSVFPVVLSDLKMPRSDGLELLENIKQHHPSTQVILTSGNAVKKDLEKALKLRAFSYIDKGAGPSGIEETLKAIEDAFQEYRENQGKLKIEKTGVPNLDIVLSYPMLSPKMPKGIEYYQGLLQREPQRFDLLLELSKLFYQNSQFFKAAEHLKKAAAINSQNEEVRVIENWTRRSLE